MLRQIVAFVILFGVVASAAWAEGPYSGQCSNSDGQVQLQIEVDGEGMSIHGRVGALSVGPLKSGTFLNSFPQTTSNQILLWTTSSVEYALHLDLRPRNTKSDFKLARAKSILHFHGTLDYYADKTTRYHSQHPTDISCDLQQSLLPSDQLSGPKDLGKRAKFTDRDREFTDMYFPRWTFLRFDKSERFGIDAFVNNDHLGLCLPVKDLYQKFKIYEDLLETYDIALGSDVPDENEKSDFALQVRAQGARLSEFMSQLNSHVFSVSEPCLDYLNNVYLAKSMTVLLRRFYRLQTQSDFYSPVGTELSLLTTFMINQSPRYLRFIKPTLRNQKKGRWQETLEDGTPLILGAFDCTERAIYLDPSLPPLDLAGVFLHEMDHLFRDRFFDWPKAKMSIAAAVLLGESLAAMTAGYFQKVYSLGFDEDKLKQPLAPQIGLNLYRPDGPFLKFFVAVFGSTAPASAFEFFQKFLLGSTKSANSLPPEIVADWNEVLSSMMKGYFGSPLPELIKDRLALDKLPSDLASLASHLEKNLKVKISLQGEDLQSNLNGSEAEVFDSRNGVGFASNLGQITQFFQRLSNSLDGNASEYCGQIQTASQKGGELQSFAGSSTAKSEVSKKSTVLLPGGRARPEGGGAMIPTGGGAMIPAGGGAMIPALKGSPRSDSMLFCAPGLTGF